MDLVTHLLNEEDVRTKVVTVWLSNHGFGPADILLEPTFEINLGRHVYRVGDKKNSRSKPSLGISRPRADILVRSRDGRNLMIVEVKSPSEPLDANAREQGLSYARLLRVGGIAPFVVLTNGLSTHIYDSLSGDVLDGDSVPVSHPHARSGFRVSGRDLAFCAEALQAFISLSSENLMEFCRLQVSHRARLLRDDDPQSGKKYVPALYIERSDAKKKLTQLLDQNLRKIVLLVGPPQVGKTNFICHMVEERLHQGLPCLFFPAIGMDRGLLEEISEDFQWTLSDTAMPYHVADKLKRVLTQVSQRIVIFIDGWNEANLSIARAIDRHCERLSCDTVQFVISMTHLAASRLLIDQAGNPSFIADTASIKVEGVPLIEIDHSHPSDCVVSLNKYTSDEVADAYSKYKEVFAVKVPDDHIPSDDPFLIRIAMEMSQGGILPALLDEPDLLARIIEKKATRVVNLRSQEARAFLIGAADEMFAGDAPLQHNLAMSRWGLAPTSIPPDGLFEAALLARVPNERGMSAIDFYFGRERDYVVACWVRDWPRLLRREEEILLSEMDTAAKSKVGTDALRWFLRQTQHQDVLFAAAMALSLIRKASIRRIILSSLWHIASSEGETEDIRMMSIIKQASLDADMLVRAEAAKLMALTTEDNDELAKLISLDRDLVVGLLEIDEQFPLGSGSAGRVVLEALQKLHWDLSSEYGEGGSELTYLLEGMLSDILLMRRKAIAKALGFIAPERFLSLLATQYDTLKSQPHTLEQYAGGLTLAISQLDDRYYGYMCPGYLDYLLDKDVDQSLLWEEYVRMFRICSPVISLYAGSSEAKSLLDLLNDLKPSNDWLEANQQSIHCADDIVSVHQLAFSFEDTD